MIITHTPLTLVPFSTHPREDALLASQGPHRLLGLPLRDLHDAVHALGLKDGRQVLRGPPPAEQNASGERCG